MVDGYITGEGGEAAIETADDDVKIIQPFTSDSGEIVKAFRQLRTSSSGTSGRIIDGVNEAIRILAARPAERRRLILSSANRETEQPCSSNRRAYCRTTRERNHLHGYLFSVCDAVHH